MNYNFNRQVIDQYKERQLEIDKLKEKLSNEEEDSQTLKDQLEAIKVGLYSLIHSHLPATVAPSIRNVGGEDQCILQ